MSSRVSLLIWITVKGLLKQNRGSLDMLPINVGSAYSRREWGARRIYSRFPKQQCNKSKFDWNKPFAAGSSCDVRHGINLHPRGVGRVCYLHARTQCFSPRVYFSSLDMPHPKLRMLSGTPKADPSVILWCSDERPAREISREDEGCDLDGEGAQVVEQKMSGTLRWWVVVKFDVSPWMLLYRWIQVNLRMFINTSPKKILGNRRPIRYGWKLKQWQIKCAQLESVGERSESSLPSIVCDKAAPNAGS